MSIKIDYEWTGELKDIVEEVNRLTPGVGKDVMTESAFRYYQKSGLVGRGTKRGPKAAVFTARELLEAAATRRMVRDGCPIAKIKDLTPMLTIEDLANIVQQGRSPDNPVTSPAGHDDSLPVPDAQSLVRGFMAQSSGYSKPPTQALYSGVPAANYAPSRTATSQPTSALSPFHSLGDRKAGPMNRQAEAYFNQPSVKGVKTPAAPPNDLDLTGYASGSSTPDAQIPLTLETSETSFTSTFDASPTSYVTQPVRQAEVTGPGGWLTILFDPNHPSFASLGEADAKRQAEAAFRTLMDRLKFRYSGS